MDDRHLAAFGFIGLHESPHGNTFCLEYGLTKRQYIATHTDIPWNAVVAELTLLHPDRHGKFSVTEVMSYQAELKVTAADRLLEILDLTKK